MNMSDFVKIVVTVPVADADTVRNAIADAGGGKIGNYNSCSFSVVGTGRFLPHEGARPHIGEVGKLEEVVEERIEVTVARDVLKDVVIAIRKNHPYEEIALDVYPLESLDF